MIHYKFEGCTEVREADIQFDIDNNEILFVQKLDILEPDPR